MRWVGVNSEPVRFSSAASVCTRSLRHENKKRTRPPERDTRRAYSSASSVNARSSSTIWSTSSIASTNSWPATAVDTTRVRYAPGFSASCSGMPSARNAPASASVGWCRSLQVTAMMPWLCSSGTRAASISVVRPAPAGPCSSTARTPSAHSSVASSSRSRARNVAAAASAGPSGASARAAIGGVVPTPDPTPVDAPP
jgi:hypothetical protein